MSTFNMKWHGPQVKAAIAREFRRRLTACCIVLVNHARTLLNVDGAMHAHQVEAEYGSLATGADRVNYRRQFNRNRAFKGGKHGDVGMRLTHQGKVVPRKPKGMK